MTKRRNAGVLDTLAHAEYAAGHWAEAVKTWDEVLAIDAYYYRPPRNQFCEKDQALLEEARRRLRGEG